MAIDAATVRKVARLARIAEPEARIEPQHSLSGQGGLPQQSAQIGTEHFDGMGFSSYGQLAAHIALNGRQQQPFGGIRNGKFQFGAEG